MNVLKLFESLYVNFELGIPAAESSDKLSANKQKML